ncbi:MAG: hypothetical protein LBC85_05540 [Fibromonadaceae bacterium]|nr:hypothetical protein [Fibromonadaceae bacterium]
MLKIKIPLCILFLHAALLAQTFYEFDIRYSVGASELSLNTAPGISLSIYPVKSFGFSAGIEYSSRQKAKSSEQSGENPPVLDSDGDSLIFRYSIENFNETYYAKILQVPLLFKYRSDTYYASAGLKIGAPVKIESKISYKGLETKGHYPEYNAILTEPLYQGFGSQEDSTLKSSIKSKAAVMLTAEYGVVFEFSESLNMLAGVFADYSLNKGFNRNLPPVIERVEALNGATLNTNDTWKSWQPWSIGLQVKLAFGFTTRSIIEEKKEEIFVADSVVTPPVSRRIIVEAETLPPPVPVAVREAAPPRAPEPPGEFPIPPLPAFLLDREPNFVFHYPETRTSPSDSLHQEMVAEIASALRERPDYVLHCVGYSEELASEAVAYETALQRVLRIRYTLNRFYGIDERRVFIYSQGSRGGGYRRAECFYPPVER